jgi:hypothetical protein
MAGSARGQCPDFGTVNFNGVVTHKGKPFQAKEVTTIVTTASDGMRTTKVTKANLFRDSNGRVRVERFYDGTDDPPETVPSDVSISDNCGRNFSLWPSSHRATVTIIESKMVSNIPFCKDPEPDNPPNPGIKGTWEDLGSRMVGGVEARGQRTTFYNSAEAKQSGAPAISVHESWCSRDLETPLGFSDVDLKTGTEITLVIRDVREVESDATLFQIPAGYTITQGDKSVVTPKAPAKDNSKTHS